MPPRVKRQPQRTCIACQKVESKRQLVRVVRRPDGEIVVDPTGKLAGRGAYLCAQRSCWQQALAQHKLSRALKVTVTDEQQARLTEYARSLPEESPIEGDDAPAKTP